MLSAMRCAVAFRVPGVEADRILILICDYSVSALSKFCFERTLPSRLSRRPVHRASAKNVYVQVEDRLPGSGAVIDDCAIAAFSKAGGIGHARGHPQQVTQQGLVFLGGIVERLDVFARNHQQVGRRLSIDIANDD